MMMDAHLENNAVQFDLDAATGRFRLHLGPISLVAGCSADVRIDGGRRVRIDAGRAASFEQEPIADAHGHGSRLRIAFQPGEAGQLHLLACVYDDHPFVALRVGLTNRSPAPLRVDTLTTLETAELTLGSGPLDAWVNGFHSWSFTGYVRHDERQPRSATRWFTLPLAANPTTPHPSQPGQAVAEWVGALIETGKQALVAGYIGVEDQFSQVFMDGRPAHRRLLMQSAADGVPLQPGDTLWGEWAILYRVDLPHPDPLGVYARAVTRLTPARVPPQAPVPAWSSWYQFFDRVSDEDMQRNQRALREMRERLPLALVQLDDGYQPRWGDWLRHNERFPGGVPAWAERARMDGFEPGLWLSPFTVERGAAIWKEHPDAVLRDRRGRPVRAGITPQHRLYGLDPTHPAVRNFVRRTIETIVHDWGIRYLKLDFLLCGALPGQRYDPTRTRAQALRSGLALIREVAGEEAVLLGCGCPLGPAVGLVDLMRVSPDVAPFWNPELFGIRAFLQRDYNVPAARNSTVISLNRAWTQRRFWWLDADNLLVREEQDLTAAEVQTLVSVMAVTDSHLVLSDDLPRVPAERLRWAASLLPLLPGEVETPCLFESREPGLLVKRYDGAAGPHRVVALFNWADEPASLRADRAELGLPGDGPLLVFDFWRGTAAIHTGGVLQAGPVEPHGAALLAVRPLADGPQLAGTDLHASMGAEITRWDVRDDVLTFTIALGREAEGHVWLYAPTPLRRASANGTGIAIEESDQQGIYRLPVRVAGQCKVIVIL